MENNSKSSVVYQGKIPGRVKYSFAFGALGKDLIYGMIATFSMIYFTDIIKVAPAFIGTMFFVAKIWDAFNDLFMGMLVDNTRSRYGKFIPWLVVGTLINAFVFVIVFTDFHLTGVNLCIFASVIYVLWGMTYTIMDIPYWSVIPNLTSDPEEREKVSVLPRIFASIGQSLIIAGFGVQIIKGLGGNYIGYHRFALIIAATFIFTMAVCVLNLPKVQTSDDKKEKMKFRDIFTVINLWRKNHVLACVMKATFHLINT
ncbi:MFS transporter [Catenibacterium mitsuokai]|uniref:MFS transporter n=1 Tax=Catenibacterium faecis TaxID=2764323 RepID=UPI003D789361